MSNRVNCQNCGAGIDLPAGYSRAKIRCPGCGYYAEVPADKRSAEDAPASAAVGQAVPDVSAPTRPAQPDRPDESPAPRRAAQPAAPAVARRVVAKPQPNPRDRRPFFDPDEPSGPNLLDGTQEESDDEVKPYAVPGTGLKPCPHCRGELPYHANFCVHCGKDITTGAKADREFQSISRQWEEGWSLQLRMQVLVLAVILDVIALVVLAITDSGAAGVMSLFVQVGLQAFLLGSYDTFALRRNTKGQTSMTRTRRVCFFALPPTKLKWKQSQGVGLIATHAPGVAAWMTLLYLVINAGTFAVGAIATSLFWLGLAALYLATAAAFYWFVIRPERHEVALCDVYGVTDEIVYRTTHREQAEEVGKLIAEATGLLYKPTL
ncbi:MAG: hypothetical protein U0871_03560 [Gemmataceae bacterium]